MTEMYTKHKVVFPTVMSSTDGWTIFRVGQKFFVADLNKKEISPVYPVFETSASEYVQEEQKKNPKARSWALLNEAFVPNTDYSGQSDDCCSVLGFSYEPKGRINLSEMPISVLDTEFERVNGTGNEEEVIFSYWGKHYQFSQEEETISLVS